MAAVSQLLNEKKTRFEKQRHTQIIDKNSGAIYKGTDRILLQLGVMRELQKKNTDELWFEQEAYDITDRRFCNTSYQRLWKLKILNTFCTSVLRG